MRNAGLDTAQAGIKIPRRNINNLSYVDDTTLTAESEGTKEPFDESEWGEWKAGIKLNIQKTKIMAPSPTTSWQIDGETMQTMTDFIFLSSKITTDGDCSHEIKRRSLLGSKVMTNWDSILKSRDITDKGPDSQGYDFSIMYGCETIKKAECQRIDAFEMCCWRRLLRVLWTARRSNQQS